MKSFYLLPIFLVASCATTGDCHGRAFALNQDRWHAGTADLRPCASARHQDH
jgi:hypothetical protein